MIIFVNDPLQIQFEKEHKFGNIEQCFRKKLDKNLTQNVWIPFEIILTLNRFDVHTVFYLGFTSFIKIFHTA